MTNNNNNNYSWTKDFSAAILLQEQGIAPSPPAGTTLEGAGGDSVTPAPHHCTPISSITPGTPSAASGSGGAEGEGGGRGEASLPCAWQGGRGGTGLPPLPPPTPEVRAGSQAHTDPNGCHGGGGSTSVPTDTTHSHAQTDSSTGTRPSRGALRALGRVEASSSGRARCFGFFCCCCCVFCLFFYPQESFKSSGFPGQQTARALPHPSLSPPWGGSSPSLSPSLSPCPKPASSQRSQGRAAWVSALQ